MNFYYDKKGRKYKGRLRICKECKKEEIVRISNLCESCNECNRKKRSSYVNPDWILADYIDSKGEKYKGRIRVCKVCGDKKTVRISIKSDLCKICRTRDRKSSIGKDELTILHCGRKQRAYLSICKKCGKKRKTRCDTKLKTKLCLQCRGKEWGKIIGPIYGPKSYKNGIGDYRKELLKHSKKHV